MRRRVFLCLLSISFPGCSTTRRLTGGTDADDHTREAFVDRVAEELEIESVDATEDELRCRYLTTVEARHEMDEEMEIIANAYVEAVVEDTTFDRLLAIGVTEGGVERWRFHVETSVAHAYRRGTISAEEFANTVIDTLGEA